MFQKILSELPSGLEPPTSSLPRMRATYCAKAACDCSQMVFYHITNIFVNREFISFHRVFPFDTPRILPFLSIVSNAL